MPIQPHMAVSRWVSDRLKPTGSSGHAKVTIRDASVIEESLKSVGGLRGAFTTEQSERYVGKIEVEIEAVGGKGLAPQAPLREYKEAGRLRKTLPYGGAKAFGLS